METGPSEDVFPTENMLLLKIRGHSIAILVGWNNPVTKYQYPTQVATLKKWEGNGGITLFQNELLHILSCKIQSSSNMKLIFYNHEALDILNIALLKDDWILNIRCTKKDMEKIKLLRRLIFSFFCSGFAVITWNNPKK